METFASDSIASDCIWTVTCVTIGIRPASTSLLLVDLRNAGAQWVDQEVVIEGKLITSRKPADIPAFNRAIQVLLEETDVCPPRLGET
jgi:putative intracellular protease/amidase